MIDKLETLKIEFETLERTLGDPALIADQSKYRQAMKRYSDLTNIIKVYKDYKEVLDRLAGAEELKNDPDLGDMASEEIAMLNPRKEELAKDLEKLLLPKDPYDDKNVIVEIRAAAGGDEASLFSR